LQSSVQASADSAQQRALLKLVIKSQSLKAQIAQVESAELNGSVDMHLILDRHS
jgi:hypothetical protein